jgi:hypothetical protein
MTTLVIAETYRRTPATRPPCDTCFRWLCRLASAWAISLVEVGTWSSSAFASVCRGEGAFGAVWGGECSRNVPDMADPSVVGGAL